MSHPSAGAGGAGGAAGAGGANIGDGGVPLAEGPADTVDLNDNNTPLEGEQPGGEGEGEDVADSKTPLANMSTPAKIAAGAAVVAAIAAAAVAISRRRRDDEDEDEE